MTTTRLVILDTDPGVDDTLALLYLRARSDLRLLAITTVFGNSDVETTTRNALWLRAKLGLSAPVYRGSAGPLTRPRRASPVHIHGENGLGDIDLGDLDLPGPDPGAAHDRIVELIRRHPHSVHLVAIGPLTNLALALRAAPDIAGLVAGVTIMGGAFGELGRTGNVTRHAEANIYNDPEAASVVLAASWPVTLTPLDATLSCILPNHDAQSLRDEAGEAGALAWAVTRSYAAAYAHYDGLNGCVLHDVAAVISLTQPELFERRCGGVSVKLRGERTGSTTIEGDAERKVTILHAALGEGVASHFLRALSC